MSDPAFRLYAAEHPQLARTLRGKLEQRRAELIIQLGEGYAADWPNYKERSGHIAGLKEAIEICEQAEREQE
jgi:hypothetical protein